MWMLEAWAGVFFGSDHLDLWAISQRKKSVPLFSLNSAKGGKRKRLLKRNQREKRETNGGRGSCSGAGRRRMTPVESSRVRNSHPRTPSTSVTASAFLLCPILSLSQRLYTYVFFLLWVSSFRFASTNTHWASDWPLGPLILFHFSFILFVFFFLVFFFSLFLPLDQLPN